MRSMLRLFCLLGMTVLVPVAASGQDKSLLRDPAITSMSAHAKGLRGDYFYPGGSVSDQIGVGMSIPDDIVKQDDGTWLVSGCRHGNCTEKSAIVVTARGEALAAAILHFHCRPYMKKTKSGGCGDDYTLTILLRPSTTSASVSWNLRDWATKAVAQYKDHNTIKNFETRMLPQ